MLSLENLRQTQSETHLAASQPFAQILAQNRPMSEMAMFRQQSAVCDRKLSTRNGPDTNLRPSELPDPSALRPQIKQNKHLHQR
jgi:hypothetical protein